MAKRLKTIADVRRYLASLINRLEGGEVEPELAGRLGYLCNILKGCIEVCDLETRLAALEKTVGDNKC